MTDVQSIMQHWGVDEGTAREALALAPAPALLSGTASDGVMVPGWVISGLAFFFIGVILGPAFYGASEAGAERLREIAEKKIRG